MRVLERPTPVSVALLPHQIDRLGHALVGCDAGPPQVVQSPQDVVVPARGERSLGPSRFLARFPVQRDDLSGRSRSEQAALEEVVISAKASANGEIGNVRKVTRC